MPILAEIAVIGRLQNPPEPVKNGAVALHVLVDQLLKEDGVMKAGWIRATAFGETAQLAIATLGRGDMIFLKGQPTFDRWADRYGEVKAGLSMTVTHMQRVGTDLAPPAKTSLPAPYSEIIPRRASPEPTPTAKTEKSKRGRKALGMVGGLPRGGQPYSAIRIKREDRTEWQAPLDWEHGDELEDCFR
jgi:single-stranded DNA-binding protein